jgi:metabotropic glutamate receptor 1
MRLKLFFLVLIILFVNFNSYNTAISKRKKIVQYGDLMVGALIPVHEQPSFGDNEEAKIGFMRKCGVIRDQYGVQRVEALLYILDKINNKNLTKLLPGIKLGLEIRDECWDSSIALEETIDFIKDTIASDENEYDDNQKDPNTTKNFANENDSKCQILKEKQNQNRILAVIGPGGSTVTINVQNLLQLFDIPQLGYSATSIDLSDKQMFKSFIRVVPSDFLQVRAMVDFVVKMNWTYLFAIYTDGIYLNYT